MKIEGLFVPSGFLRRLGGHLYYEIIKEHSDGVVVKDFDVPYAKPQLLLWREFDRLRIKYGVWRKVGLYDFCRVDDPAADNVRLAHEAPQTAGRLLYEVEQRAKEAEAELNRLRAELDRLRKGGMI